ncbi:Cation transporter [Cordyceps militaris]|uniref:Cation transporter n=1 Tax=Cordyceps militaris TaxID=73501 RepID=A0A2H4SF00_CORMI|nr:Cation transporter [Cordyceps militaris]
MGRGKVRNPTLLLQTDLPLEPAISCRKPGSFPLLRDPLHLTGERLGGFGDSMGTLASLRSMSSHRLNFLTIHYCYFVVVCLLSSVVFWASSSPQGRISYVDSLFVVVSAMTEAGLNTVNLSTMTTWQQTILFLLIMLGGTIWVSIWTVFARRAVFLSPLRAHGVAHTIRTAHAQGVKDPSSGSGPGSASSHSASPRVCSAAAEKDLDMALARTRGRPYYTLPQKPSSPRNEEDGLADGKSQRICGCEYRALELLSIIVPIYFVLWQLLGCIGLGAWMHNHMPDTALANGINPWWLGVFNGVSAFNNSGMSLLDANMVPFQEAHFVLITMGLMILAGNTAYPIFLRLILWSAHKLLDLTTEADSFQSTKLAVQLLLKDPRRIYTNLFPSRLTWWLFFMLVCLNSIDWVLFELLNLNNPVVDSIPVGPRVLVGLFQALAVRSGGFYVVPIAQIAIGVQFLYVIMMYISVYPVVMTIRQSSVYTYSQRDGPGIELRDAAHSHLPKLSRAVSYPIEKRSLTTGHRVHLTFATPAERATWRGKPGHPVTTTTGVSPPLLYSEQLSNWPREKRPSHHARLLSLHGTPPPPTYDSHMSFIHQQIHGQLAQDIWWLVLAVLVIVIIESSQFNADPINHSVFNIIFEVASAYGTVGISVGTPSGAYSFSGTWYTGSKLILCLVMLRGRHRGLPTALDHAIRLPEQHLNCKEYDMEDK